MTNVSLTAGGGCAGHMTAGGERVLIETGCASGVCLPLSDHAMFKGIDVEAAAAPPPYGKLSAKTTAAQIMPSLFGELNLEIVRSISRTFSRWRSISCRRTTSRDGHGARGTGR